VADIDEIFRRAEAKRQGGNSTQKTAVGGQFLAEISDSEGNRIGLSAGPGSGGSRSFPAAAIPRAISKAARRARYRRTGACQNL
jgi:hypothetical protein